MKWSWKLATVAGTEVRVHATFFILILWLVLNYGSQGQRAAEIAVRVGFILVLFGCVVLHELGHVAAARRYGIGTRDITLLPIGGLARLERIPREPRHELVVALAGPAVNVAIAMLLGAGLLLAGVSVPTPEFNSLALGALGWNLVAVNVFLVAFNMLPAFPMDGGRVLRALLAMRMSYVQATRHAAIVGQIMAVGFGLIGLLVNPFLILIAIFVWVGAAYEANVVTLRSSLEGLSVRQAMLSRFQSLALEDPLTKAVDMTLAGSQKDFPVLDKGRIVALLTQQDVLRGLSRKGRDGSVGDAMACGARGRARESPPAAGGGARPGGRVATHRGHRVSGSCRASFAGDGSRDQGERSGPVGRRRRRRDPRDRNGSGYTDAELERFLRLAKSDPVVSPALFDLAQRARQSGFGAPNPGEGYLYARASKKEPFDIVYSTVTLTAIANLEDQSSSITPEFVYTGAKNTEARLRLAWLHGSENTEFGEKLSDLRVELRLRYFF